jgi:SAM-dependent methyltransferase
MLHPKPGIPSVDDFKRASELPNYAAMSEYSAQFLERHLRHLRNRENPAGLNSFYLWSRRWEYPYVGDRILTHFNGRPGKILDAGSGLYFFPFFLCKQNPNLSILCVDQTARWQSAYSDIVPREGAKVEFRPGDIRKLNVPDHSLDGIYSISVLEHTERYEEIIAEFHRVLKPGAPLWLTIDISLDGCSDIPVPQSKDLVRALTKHFRLKDYSQAASRARPPSRRSSAPRKFRALTYLGSSRPCRLSRRR